MEVFFESRAKRNHIISRGGDIIAHFTNGKFKTSDKRITSELLKSEELKNKDIKLASPAKAVANYLEGKEPDRLTLEILENVSAEGLYKLANYTGLDGHANQPVVIRSMLIGTYLDNFVEGVLKEFRTDIKLDDLLKRAMDAGVIERRGAHYMYVPEDRSISKTESDVQLWCIDNKEALTKHITASEQEKEEEK
jgi:hypothetical protein